MNKIFLTLAIFVGFSAHSYAQNSYQSDPQKVTTSYHKDREGNQWVTVKNAPQKGSKIKLSYDDANAQLDPNGVYHAQDDQSNDGFQNNVQRNINYMNNGAIQLPPNTGYKR